MVPSTFLKLVASMIEAVTGAPADEAQLDRVRATLAAVGMGEDRLIPLYFFDGLRRILAGDTAPWVRLPEHEQGLGWVLCRLVDVLPGTSSEEVGAFDRFAVPALRRGVVVHRRDAADGYSEWYAVTEVDSAGAFAADDADDLAPSPWPLASHAAAAPLRILDTFGPTPAQVREWAYDPQLRFAEQDEDLAITQPEYVEQLIELAADPGCPKRGYLLRIIDRIATMPRPDLVATMTRARDAARATGDHALSAWADGITGVLEHLHGSGPVTADAARTVARSFMRGPRRPTVVLDETAGEPWWQFRARFPEADGRWLDALYIHAGTGAMLWSPEPIPAEALAAAAPPAAPGRAVWLGPRR